MRVVSRNVPASVGRDVGQESTFPMIAMTPDQSD
jgi:hypothetical protein